MQRYHPQGSSPRGIVARAIDSELKSRGDDYVLLDITHKPASFVKSASQYLREVPRIRIRHDERALPVVPAAHYFCGGVSRFLGLTAISNRLCLWRSGLHGASRGQPPRLELSPSKEWSSQEGRRSFDWPPQRNHLSPLPIPPWDRVRRAIPTRPS